MRGCSDQKMLGKDLGCGTLYRRVHLAVFMFPDEEMWQRWNFRKASVVDEDRKSLLNTGENEVPDPHTNQRCRMFWASEGRGARSQV